jgi:hypothetical protein
MLQGLQVTDDRRQLQLDGRLLLVTSARMIAR